MQVTTTAIVLTLASLFTACQRRVEAPPSDFVMKTLDPSTAVQEADVIVLAYPVARKDLRHVFVPLDHRVEPMDLLETETTLKVMRVYKGKVLAKEIRFRHYEGYSFILMGPPQGPSGKMGSKGVFFLRQKPNGTYRSLVDYYRPDFPTRWIIEPVDELPCTPDSACIARLLFSVHPQDDVQVFSGEIGSNVANSQLLVGILETFRLLDSLAARSSEVVRRLACEEEYRRYVLEMSTTCRSEIASTDAERDYLTRSQRLQEHLRQGGLTWVRERIQTNSEAEIKEYLQILIDGPNSETRKLATGLLKIQRERHH